MRSVFFAAAAAIAMLLSAPFAAAQGASKPASAQRPAEDFATLPVLEGPQLSPKGDLMAAKVAIQGEVYFAVVPLGGGAPRIARVEGDLNWWRWVNNDWLVAGIGSQMRIEGQDIYIRQAIGVSAEGKAVRLIRRSEGQISDDVIWIAHDGSPRILLAAQHSFYASNLDFWMTVSEVDVSTGKSKRVMLPREGVMTWITDADGVIRMGIRRLRDGRHATVLYRADPDAGFREVALGEDADTPLPALFLPDGSAIAYADDASGLGAAFEYDLAEMKLGKKLYSSQGFDLGGLIETHDGKRLAGVVYDEDRSRTEWIDPELKKLSAEIGQMVQGAQSHIVSYSDTMQRAIVLVAGADSPGAYFLYDRPTHQLARIAMINPAIDLARVNPVRTVRYKARDGLEIAAVLTLPKGASQNLPVIVMPHGGPFARDDESWDWWAQFLANRGYAVIQPNYRGSSGYGTNFTKKGAGQWGMAMQDDLNDALTYLAKEGIADPKRACMVGGSYGGYAALRAAQRDGALYRCAVSYAGVSDLEALRRYDRQFLNAGARADWLSEQAPDFKAISPLYAPEQFSIPVLIMHGKEDETVPVEQSRRMVDKLRSAGKEVIYIEQPEADHHFRRADDRLQFLKELETFLDKYNPA